MAHLGLGLGLGISPFGLTGVQKLIAEATQPTLTNTSTGSRKSMVLANTSTIAANGLDQTVLPGGIVLNGVSGGATNKTTTDITTWTTGGAAWTTNVKTEPSTGVYRLELSTVVAGSFVGDRAVSVTNAAVHDITFQARLISGDPANLKARFANNGSPFTSDVSIEMSDLSDGWKTYCLNGASSSSAQQVGIYSVDPMTVTLEIRDIRCVEKTSAFPAFPDGSVAGVSYAEDRTRFTMPALPVGTMAVPFHPYLWTNECPENNYPRVFSALTDSFRCEYKDGGEAAPNDQFQFFAAGGSATCPTPMNGEAHVAFISWDGTTVTASIDGNSDQTIASAAAPTGDMYLAGRSNAGGYALHTACGALLWSRVLTNAERVSIAASLRPTLNAVSFR